MEKHIYFVRHGETVGNVEKVYHSKDAELTETGQAQAAAVAERVAHLCIEALVSSDFLRAKNTAAIIGEKIGLSPTEQSLFGEWIEPKHLLGKPYTHPEAVEMRTAVFGSEDPHYRHRDEETFAEMKVRATQCFAFLEQHPASRICVITHLGFLRVLVGFVLLGEENYDKRAYNAMFHRLTASNTGITYVQYDEEKQRWRLVTWNDQSHLG